jgi:hypothetical protein
MLINDIDMNGLAQGKSYRKAYMFPLNMVFLKKNLNPSFDKKD